MDGLQQVTKLFEENERQLDLFIDSEERRISGQITNTLKIATSQSYRQKAEQLSGTQAAAV
mgnify:CR=1 FL=1